MFASAGAGVNIDAVCYMYECSSLRPFPGMQADRCIRDETIRAG